MAVPLEQFVKQLEDSGILAGDTLKDSDDDLLRLAALKQLKTLHLTAGRATAAGVAGLKKSLPDCNVICNQPGQ